MGVQVSRFGVLDRGDEVHPLLVLELGAIHLPANNRERTKLFSVHIMQVGVSQSHTSCASQFAKSVLHTLASGFSRGDHSAPPATPEAVMAPAELTFLSAEMPTAGFF